MHELKKIIIVDAYAKSEKKKDLLRNCIQSLKKLNYDILLVGHCYFPEDIINSVNYYIFDSDNRFSKNHVFSFKFIDNFEIRKNIFSSHEYPIIRSMRMAFNLASSMGYDFFHFTEFDHIYSENAINKLIELEQKLIEDKKDFLFFKPLNAQFGDLVGVYFESCFFSGNVKKFISLFESFFPKTIEEYNESFAIRFPNCLEHFFFLLFNNENCHIIEEYVKHYFKDSLINVSSYQDSNCDIILDEKDDPFLVLTNNNNYDSLYEVYFNDILEHKLTINSYTKLIKIPFDCKIKINRYFDNTSDEEIEMVYSESKKPQYKMNGTIINHSKIEELFNINFDKNENKLTFEYISNEPKTLLVSIKDIDSYACIYSFNQYFEKGFNFWSIPLPKTVIDFQNNPNFGGFLFQFFENNSLIGEKNIRIKEIPITKLICDFSDTEPIFMNYVEFYEDKIYDEFDIHNLSVVFDVGANVGLWSNYILTRGAKQVYSFEPNKKAIKHLNKNLGDNKRVKIIPFALHYEKTKIPFYSDEKNSLISSSYSQKNYTPSPEDYIETVTLDEIINQYNIPKIDLLKVDIEGAEFDVFNNITEETLSKVDSILIEYHDFYFEDGIERVQKLIQKLESFGYNLTLPENYKFIFGYKKKKNYWLGVSSNINLINLHEKSKNFSWENYNNGIQDGYDFIYTEMYNTFDQYTQGCTYERYGCKIEKDDIVVDIGGNVGIFSNYAFEKGASKIFTFEPGDLSFSCLIRNKPKNCEVFKLAVSNKFGFNTLSCPTKNDTMGASILQDGEEKNMCYTITVNEFFEKNILTKIDFLKIDTEGSELNIIDGISDENLAKINKISMEIHMNILTEDEVKIMFERLVNNGFNPFTLYLGDGSVRIYSFWR